MKYAFGLMVSAGALAASLAIAEPAKLNPQAAKEIAPPAQQLVPPPAPQKPGNQQQQGQQNPVIPNQQLPPAQQPPANQPVPDQTAIQDPARQSIERSRAPGPDRGVSRDAVGTEQIDALRPARESLGLDRLNADDARKQPGFDPSRFGRPAGAGDAETDALVEQLRGLTGKGNRDRMSDQTRSYGSGIVTDPQSLLNGASAGLAGDEPNGGLGRMTSRERMNDGGSASTYTRSDGSTTTIYRDRSGAEVSREHRSRDSAGREVVTTHTGDQEVTEVTGDGHTVRVEAYGDARRGDYEVRTVVDGRPLHSGRTEGPVLTMAMASQTHDRLFRGTARDVDPDSPHGSGSGSPVDTDKRPDDVVHGSDAREGVGPGARPDENAGSAATPRLNVNVDLVGQPNPTEGAAGGSGPVYQGYNPNDFVRPPPPNP